MRCGLCAHPMRRVEELGVELDACEGCEARFFDPGELATRLEDERVERSVALARADLSEHAAACPRCDAAMRAVRVADAAGRPGRGDVVVFVCTGCHGLLLSPAAWRLAEEAGMRGVHHDPSPKSGATKRRVVFEMLDALFELFQPH